MLKVMKFFVLVSINMALVVSVAQAGNWFDSSLRSPSKWKEGQDDTTFGIFIGGLSKVECITLATADWGPSLLGLQLHTSYIDSVDFNTDAECQEKAQSDSRIACGSTGPMSPKQATEHCSICDMARDSYNGCSVVLKFH